LTPAPLGPDGILALLLQGVGPTEGRASRDAELLGNGVRGELLLSEGDEDSLLRNGHKVRSFRSIVPMRASV